MINSLAKDVGFEPIKTIEAKAETDKATQWKRPSGAWYHQLMLLG